LHSTAVATRIAILVGILLVVIAVAYVGSLPWSPRRRRPPDRDPKARDRMAWMRWYWAAAAVVCALLVVYLAKRSLFPFHADHGSWYRHREGLNLAAFLVTLAGYPFALRGFLAWRRRSRSRRSVRPVREGDREGGREA
jgi:hypothetical protein